MKNHTIYLILTLVFFSNAFAKAQEWQGTWNTSFGEVRIVQEGNKLYGDYKNVGTIEATVSGNSANGVFTNGSNKGVFKWTKISNAFTGKWGWGTNVGTSNWTGTKRNNTKPKLTSSIASKLKSATPNASSWTGTWNTSYGELRLIEKDGKVFGDYKDVGYIEASKKGNTITGIYTNENSNGLIQFTRSGGTFQGKWGANENIERMQGAWTKNLKLSNNWNGTIKSTTRPILKHVNAKKLNIYQGRYRITVTEIVEHTFDNGLFAIFNTNREIYGTIGIRLKGKGQSGNVEIKPVGNKKARVWEVSSSNPVDTSIGTIEVDRMREFNIQGDLANSDLIVNIQVSMSESDGFVDKKFPWKQRNLYLKDMVLGQQYFVTTKSGKEYISIGYMVEKI